MWTHRRSAQRLSPRSLDHRDSYERDRTRVIHCSAFRRMQGKTQVLRPAEGDFHRTRLTHSLEVASIAVSISRNMAANPRAVMLAGLLPSDDLISTIGLSHDIGHPPFGHSGEAALHALMRDDGGFEGNAQTLRLLTKVEDSYGEFGLDLTRRTLLGILKYPVPYACVRGVLPKCYFDSEQAEVDWLLAPFSPADRQLLQTVVAGQAVYCSFDCSIMNIADDIAYGIHDLEDAIHLQLIQREVLDTPLFRALLAETGGHALTPALLDDLFAASVSARKQAIGELVNYLITAVQIAPVADGFEHQLLANQAQLQPAAQQLLTHCIELIYREVIDAPRAKACAQRGQMVLEHLFAAMSASPLELLSATTRQHYLHADNSAAAKRVICDEIACMTDEHAQRLYARLLGLSDDKLASPRGFEPLLPP